MYVVDLSKISHAIIYIFKIRSSSVEMRFCSSSGQNTGQYIRHLTAGCFYQHTVQNSKEYFKKWIKYLKLKKNKMVEIQDGRYNSGLYKKVLCPPYVWMPSVHTQYKESMLCQIKGVSICPDTFGCPICLNAPLYVGMPLYVWMAPCMFGHHHIFGCPLYA